MMLRGGARWAQNMGALCVLTALFLQPSTAQASGPLYTIWDGNSEAVFDPESEAGHRDWLVDGIDHLVNEWFWVRIGSTGGELSLDELDLVGVSTFDTNAFSDNRKDTISMLFREPGQSPSFEVELSFKLRGSATNSLESDLVEILRVNNLTRSPLDLHVFQYVDFDLDGTAGGDSVVFEDVNSVRQNGEASSLNETVVTPASSHREANLFPTTLASLNDGLPTTLNDNVGPVNGNVTWAFQWDRTVAGGGSFILSKTKSITVPEPTSMALLALGLLARRRTQRIA